MFQPEESRYINEDINSRKEFRMLASSIQENVLKNPYVQLADSSHLIKQNMHTMLKSYQVFVGNYFNPNTPYTRLLMKWETGVGKTIGALRIAMEYVRIYNELAENVEYTGSVFIIGFTEDIFKRELLNFPQFGFVNEKELEQLRFLRDKGMAGDKQAEEQYKDLYSRLKRRLTSRKKNGFFRFYGYKELSNRLFITKLNITTLEREEIIEKINSGEIQLNHTLLDEFANSLIICDEIHRLYNSIEKNNWGITIETILNYHSSCRALYLSATPLNNSPTEIVDLLNLLLPRNKYPLLTRADIFSADNELTKEGAAKIEAYLRGRISFVRDVNPEKFASREIVGERIPGIELLRFVRCDMSAFHYNTYKDAVSDTGIPNEGVYITDICLPDPSLNGDPYRSPGLYKTHEIREKYNEASAEWRKKYKLHIRNNEVGGEALAADHDLNKISSKYSELVKQLHADLKSAAGKTFVYHNSKQISGVFFIENVLLANGFIGLNDRSKDDTLCVICGHAKNKHSKAQMEAPTRGGGNIRETQYKNHVQVDFNGRRLWDYTNEDGYMVIHLNDSADPPADLQELAEYVRNIDNAVLRLCCDDSRWSAFTSLLNFTNIEMRGEYTLLSRKPITSQSGGFEIRKMIPAKLNDNHHFQPARMIVLHGDMDKKDVNFMIDRFNKPANTDGSSISVLVASRFLKESYTLVAVRNIMVLSRPDNISILLQIIGRAVRDRVHDLVHPEQRHVTIRLFVSSLPKTAKGLSYEERKYKEKVESNKIVRQIEKIMHESAIDGLINEKMIWQQKSDQLDIEPYKSSIVSARDVVKESSFWAYFSKFEVEYLKYMIKVCFITYSRVWKYLDLYKTIREPPFPTTIDTKYISQELFNVALDSMLYRNDHKTYKPIFMDSEIISIGSNYYTLVHQDEYYIMVSYDIETKEVFLDVESFSRNTCKMRPACFSLKEYVNYDSQNNYQNKKERFIARWGAVELRNMKNAIYSFGAAFHTQFIEDVIKYIYNMYTKGSKDSNWLFYVKIMQFYSLFDLIAYASTVRSPIRENYSSIVEHVATPKEAEAAAIKEKIMTSNPTWVTTGMVDKYDFMTHYKPGKKIRADVLPVGHFLGKLPRFYINEAWATNAAYSKITADIKENDIIVGYEERQDGHVDIRFKIRHPVQHMKKHNDQRMIERGSACSTKSKDELFKICKSLDISTDKKDSSADLCDRIKMNLIHRELKARSSGSKVKWYYMFYEESPVL